MGNCYKQLPVVLYADTTVIVRETHPTYKCNPAYATFYTPSHGCLIIIRIMFEYTVNYKTINIAVYIYCLIVCITLYLAMYNRIINLQCVYCNNRTGLQINPVVYL